ncbi:hypothetical protein L6252_03400 [Candidatus Parcubacteria bacterium]|nr:hypothetical protein [Candidatus Parcubacteria bacterium]
MYAVLPDVITIPILLALFFSFPGIMLVVLAGGLFEIGLGIFFILLALSIILGGISEYHKHRRRLKASHRQ